MAGAGLTDPTSYLGAGFETTGEHWHWMGRSASLQTPREGLPAEISFELTCAPSIQYRRFPFELKISLGGRYCGMVCFEKLEQTQHVHVIVGESEHAMPIFLESSETFVSFRNNTLSSEKRWSVRLSNFRIWPNLPSPPERSFWSEAGRFSFDGKTDPRHEGGASLTSPLVFSRTCPVCCDLPGLENRKLGLLVPERNLGPEYYELLLCPHCDLLFQSPLPRREVLEYIYSVSAQFTGSDQYSGDRAKSAMTFYGDRLEALLRRLSRVSEPLRLLEVGGGPSWMSRACKAGNKSSITVAQDITAEVAHICAWVDHYLVGEFDSLIGEIAALGPYQVISLTHVIEHLTDPAGILRRCRPMLEQNGIVFVTAPHRPLGWTPSSAFSLWKEWSYNHVPAHLQYFNARSMHHCAEQAGLTLVYFDASSEGGQGLEAWLSHDQTQSG